MEKNYRIDADPDVIAVRFQNKPSMVDVRMAIQDLAERNPSTGRLWDVSCGELTLSRADVLSLAQHWDSKLSPARVAVVAPGDFEFAMARMYGSYRAPERQTLAIFRTETEARAWLTRPEE